MKVKKTESMQKNLLGVNAVVGTKQKTNGESPAKRAKLLPDESDCEDPGSSGPEEPALKINEEFAKRFEHNKKREEMHRLEGIYGKSSVTHKRKVADTGDEDEDALDSEELSDSEEDDEEGILVTETLDAEISAIVRAIRAKDPRVYDGQSKFYTEPEEGEGNGKSTYKAERPMFLKDYHRRNLLEGHIGQEAEGEGNIPRTFIQEQEDLKRTIIREMHAAADEEDGDENDDGFLISKREPKGHSNETAANKGATRITEKEVAIANKDPELFLSNFMSSRAWVPIGPSKFQPFESDDEEEDRRAEEFEQAYNLRFEDPEGSKEKLMTHSREAAAKHSFRREEVSSRKRAREAQRQKKEEEKRRREEEKTRLKKLKIEELEEKVQKIKEAAGLKGKAICDNDWVKLLEDGWEGDRWEQEMSARFGEAYYALGEDIDDENGNEDGKKRKLKRPKWDDDIDIRDLIPGFEDEEKADKSVFTFSDGNGDEVESEGNMEETGQPSSGGKSKKERLRERVERKREARQGRKRIEQFVDEKCDFDDELPLSSSSKVPTRFRYRETSPEVFGLTPLDILMASDSQLNQFVGLKKMAAFRDPEKKRKDKKRLGKKARLRQWRKATFGDESGPSIQEPGAQVEGKGDGHGSPQPEFGVDIREGNKKRKRSRKGKGKGMAIET